MNKVANNTRNKAIIFLVGASGSGKTIIGQRLANNHGWALIDTDAVIIEKCGKRISDIFSSKGEAYFRNLESGCIEDIRSNEKLGLKLIVATGGGLAAIPGMMQRLNKTGITIYLKASLDTLWKRLSTDPQQLQDRPLLRNGGKSVLTRLLSEREKFYYQSTLVIDTDQMDVDEVCDLLAGQLDSIANIALNK